MLAVTGDFNVDLLRPDKADTKKYNDVLESMNLDQLVTKPTRTTPHSATLIDHIITNMKQQVSHCDVLPSPFISDHDAAYFCLNVRVPRFVPRFKMIRNERNLIKIHLPKALMNSHLVLYTPLMIRTHKLTCLTLYSVIVLTNVHH
jgi:hypothetical protein